MNTKVVTGIRIFFGLFMFVFGLNKFLSFMPFPPIPGDGGTLMEIYFTSGFMNIIGVFEILGGLALIIGKFVPLALIFLLAILMNALIFHGLHNLENIAPAIIGTALGLTVYYTHRDRFAELLSP